MRKNITHGNILRSLLILIYLASVSLCACTGLFSSEIIHAPSGFTAVEGNMQIALSWINEIDSDKVLIRYDTSNYPDSIADGKLAYEGTGASFVHSNVEYGNTYYYTIWSEKLKGDQWVYSDSGSHASGSPGWLAPPSFRAIKGNQQNTLSWQKGSDDDQVLVRYNQTGYPTSVTDGELLYRGNETSYVHTGLYYGETYYYTIWSARLRDGGWIYSGNGSHASGSPDWLSPSSFTAVEGNQQNTLSWQVENDDDQVIIRYNQTGYFTSATDGELLYRGSETSYVHTGLDYGETYYYTIWSARLKDAEWIYSDDKESTSATPYWRGLDGEEIQEYVRIGLARIVGADGQYIELFNNPESHNPTWEELKQFLWLDETDKKIYNSSFKCADFAEMLHNNAENAGIRSGYVAIHFNSSPIGHALNVFNTRDRGTVYIDSTGTMEGNLNADKTVNLVMGSEYIAVSIFNNPGYSSQWSNMGQVSGIWIQW